MSEPIVVPEPTDFPVVTTNVDTTFKTEHSSLNEITQLHARIAVLEAERKSWEEQSRLCQLTWARRPDPAVLAAHKTLPLLIEELAQRIGDDDGSNILIEGDNYHALLELTYTHREKVDVIYIDPPYNTQSAAIPYEDSFEHSTWLSMMEPRLRLAWDLLTPTGVLFIQIGIAEMARLRLLGDQIFGYGNFVTTIAVKMSGVQGMKVAAAKGGNIVKNTEYIHVWAKNGRQNIGIRPIFEKTSYDEHYSIYLSPSKIEGEFLECDLGKKVIEDEKIRMSLDVLGLLDPKTGVLTKNRLTDAYEMSPQFREWTHKNSEFIVRDHLTTGLNIPEEVSNKTSLGHTILWKSGGRDYLLGKNSKGTICQRIALTEKIQIVAGIRPEKRISTMRGDWWDDYYLDMGNVSKEGDTTFLNGKKPLRLMKDLLRFACPLNGTVLDFFAGSGSTGHAVLDLNHEDSDSNRRFILVTSNEPETDELGRPTGRLICRDICYERLKNVMLGYERGKTKIRSLGGGLRYFIADKIGLSFDDAQIPDHANRVIGELAEDTLRVRSDCFRLVKRQDEFVIFESGLRILAILHRYAARQKLVETLTPIIGGREIHIYPFTPSQIADSGWFRDRLGEKATVMRLPDEITNIYERLILGARRA